ncbi:unnamed protein product [Vitrella brassicaformis CCMP3155]|uniref:Uncharacterized protein n=1 Tax=Vitrella brassicaformis (strain CCMP3155) TaxID=1169540 RepID=A0A0G4FNH5_VITBC|nr:unnamed protein product [Vitrella brassicaformis CCMP3155]|eukprot:CEM15805.1 unnamed protein product [Vitrella brassicaformis CCMP3155]
MVQKKAQKEQTYSTAKVKRVGSYFKGFYFPLVLQNRCKHYLADLQTLIREFKADYEASDKKHPGSFPLFRDVFRRLHFSEIHRTAEGEDHALAFQLLTGVCLELMRSSEEVVHQVGCLYGLYLLYETQFHMPPNLNMGGSGIIRQPIPVNLQTLELLESLMKRCESNGEESFPECAAIVQRLLSGEALTLGCREGPLFMFQDRQGKPLIAQTEARSFLKTQGFQTKRADLAGLVRGTTALIDLAGRYVALRDQERGPNAKPRWSKSRGDLPDNLQAMRTNIEKTQATFPEAMPADMPLDSPIGSPRPKPKSKTAPTARKRKRQEEPSQPPQPPAIEEGPPEAAAAVDEGREPDALDQLMEDHFAPKGKKRASRQVRREPKPKAKRKSCAKAKPSAATAAAAGAVVSDDGVMHPDENADLIDMLERSLEAAPPEQQEDLPAIPAPPSPLAAPPSPPPSPPEPKAKAKPKAKRQPKAKAAKEKPAAKRASRAKAKTPAKAKAAGGAAESEIEHEIEHEEDDSTRVKKAVGKRAAAKGAARGRGRGRGARPKGGQRLTGTIANPARRKRDLGPEASEEVYEPEELSAGLLDSMIAGQAEAPHLQQQQQQQRVPQAAEPLDRDEELLRELQELGAERGMEADEEDEEED